MEVQMNVYKNFVSTDWLLDHRKDDDLFIFDCRFDPFEPEVYGPKAYKMMHIEGAYYLDMDEDLSQHGGEHGGARIRADVDMLGAKLAGLGADMDSKIICYDDGIYSAARAWWQLTYMGYTNVYVLDGGFREWFNKKYMFTKELPKPKGKGSFIPNIHEEMFADIEDVKLTYNDDSKILLDSRNGVQFTGIEEKIYSKKGHIPGSINIYYISNLISGRRVQPLRALKKEFKVCRSADEIITYSGSGVGAAVSYMCLTELGYNVRLYAGGISDWATYDNLIVESFWGSSEVLKPSAERYADKLEAKEAKKLEKAAMKAEKLAEKKARKANK